MARSRGRDRINRASNPQTVAKRKQETTKEAGLDSAAFLSTPIHAHTKLPTQAHGACVRWARTRRRKELCARAPERKRERDGQGLWRVSLWGTSTLPCTRYEGVVLPTTTARRYTCFLLLVRLAGIKAPTTRETGRPSGDAVTWGGERIDTVSTVRGKPPGCIRKVEHPSCSGGALGGAEEDSRRGLWSTWYVYVYAYAGQLGLV